MLGDGEQRRLAARDQRGVPAAAQELAERVDEAVDAPTRIGQHDALGARARPVGGCRATVRNGAHAVPGVGEAAAGSQSRALLRIGHDDGGQRFLPAGSWSCETETAPAAMAAKSLS